MMLTLSPADNARDNGKNAADSFGNLLALLGAFCLFLSAVEYMIPKPLPFMRVGLANLPLMIACNIFPLRVFLVLVCVKVFGQALITGTLFSYIFLFSITGTFLSALIMFCLRRLLKDRISFAGIGTAGAVTSSVSQIALAGFFIFKENICYIAPAFLAAGLVTGVVLGVFCEIFTAKSKWYKDIISCKEKWIKGQKGWLYHEPESVTSKSEENSCQRKIKHLSTAGFYNESIGANALFIAGLLIMPALLFNPSTWHRLIQLSLFLLFAVLCGKKINIFLTFFVTLFIIAFNLIIPYGQVLFSAGVFKVTSGALEAGIHRAVTLQALIMLSRAAVRDDLKLPGAFGRLLGESLQMFTALMSRKVRITKGSLTASFDNLIAELSREGVRRAEEQKIKTKPSGYMALIIIVLLSWSVWIFA